MGGSRWMWESRGTEGEEGIKLRSKGTCVHFESFVLRGRCLRLAKEVPRAFVSRRAPILSLYPSDSGTFKFALAQAYLLTDKSTVGRMIIERYIQETKTERESRDQRRSESVNGFKRSIQRGYVRDGRKKNGAIPSLQFVKVENRDINPHLLHILCMCRAFTT